MDGLAGMSFAEWMTALEWVAAGLGLVNIALLVFRSVWNYAFGIVSVAIYIFVFFESRLYAESGDRATLAAQPFDIRFFMVNSRPLKARV